MKHNLNPDNAHIFGGDDDSLWLGPKGTDLSPIVDLSEAVLPEALVDCGWMSDDGPALSPDDSTSEIRGHQGNDVVKVFMSESSTTLTATLLESKLDIVRNYWDAAVERVTVGEQPLAKMTAPASRKVITLCGVLDLFDTSNEEIQWRYIFKELQLGKRGELAFKNQEITAYNYELKVIGGFVCLTNAPAMIPAGS
jgi:hypothetical protein